MTCRTLVPPVPHRETAPGETDAMAELAEARREYDAAWRALQRVLDASSWMPSQPRAGIDEAQGRVMEAGKRVRQAAERVRALRRRVEPGPGA